MPRELSRTDLSRLAGSGQTIFVAGATGEPTAILDAWREARCLDRATLMGLQIPGVNRFSPEEFGDACRFCTSFLAPSLRSAFAHGWVDLLPMHHTDFYGWLAAVARIDLAVFQVSPPDARGRCDLGPCTDLLPAILSRNDVRLVAQINPRLPRCKDGYAIDCARLDGVFHAQTPLPEFKAATGEDTPEIAARAAALIGDGATLQVGIGRLPDQVLACLGGRRRLKLHGGTVSAAALRLLQSGAVDHIIAGMAIGDAGFYAEAAASEIAFRPVPITHGQEGLSEIARFISLNAALEIDLFGQVNCEVASGRLIAGFGGLNDFIRAARASAGGRSVLMLPACVGNGAASRIVARIGQPGLVSVQRGDVDIIITEHGVADLRGLDIDRRAAALIAVAAPRFRAELAESWDRVRGDLA